MHFENREEPTWPVWDESEEVMLAYPPPPQQQQQQQQQTNKQKRNESVDFLCISRRHGSPVNY